MGTFAGPTATVATAADLLSAAASPGVSAITVAGHIALQGTPVAVSGAGRSLTITAAAAACPAPPATAADLPPGLCAIDARGLSRLFEVSGGASLALAGLALVNGNTFSQAGSVLVEAGSRFAATGCAFARSSTVAAGGAVLVTGPGALATFQTCARPPPPRLLRR